MQVLGNCARCDGLHGSGLSLALPDRAQRRLGVDWASRSTALASYIATTSDPAPTGSTDDRTGSIGSLMEGDQAFDLFWLLERRNV